MTEIVSDLRSKNPSSTTSIDCPIFDIFGVRPHQVTERTLMRNFNLAVNSSDLINSLDLGTESSVHTKDLS